MTWRELVQRLRSAAFFGLGDPRPLPAARAGVTRRQFLKVAGIAAATVALLPETLALDEPLDLEARAHGISIEDIDGILKAIYLPAIVNMDRDMRERSDFGIDPEPLKALDAQAAEFNKVICEQEGYDPVPTDWILRELLAAYEIGRGQVPRGDPASPPGAGRATGQ